MSELSSSEPECVIYEKSDGAAWIRFNRPQVMNAFSQESYRRILDALAQAAEDEQVFSVIFVGEGGRAFSTGGDMKDMARREAAGEDVMKRGLGEAVFEAVAEFRKPTIAAIDGHCLAGGMEVAILCDMRVATEKSRFGLPEVRLSLMPEPGLVELPRLIPLGEALRMALTGAPMAARRAYEIGFIQELAPDREALLSTVRGMAGEIAYAAPLAAEAYKQVIRLGRSMTPEQATQYRNVLWDRIQTTEDRHEGMRAFAEKRSPVWRRK